MSYDFGKKKIGAGEKQERNGGMYSKTLLGQSIVENVVPSWTADGENRPFVVFRDPDTGNVFGLSKYLLNAQGERDVIVIFDTKGDYLETFGSQIPDSQKIVIGNGEKYRKITSYHNIFAEVMPRGIDGKLVYTTESDEDALELCEQLFQTMNSETQPIFPAMAEQVVAALMIYYMRTYWRSDQSKLNNQEFIHFLAGSTNEDLKKILELDYMSDWRSCQDYISGKSNQTQGVNSYFRRQTGGKRKHIFSVRRSTAAS